MEIQVAKLVIYVSAKNLDLTGKHGDSTTKWDLTSKIHQK